MGSIPAYVNVMIEGVQRWFADNPDQTYRDLSKMSDVGRTTIGEINNGVRRLYTVEIYEKLHRAIPQYVATPQWVEAVTVLPSEEKAVLDHICVVRQFSDQKTATEINRMLVRIEKLSPAMLAAAKSSVAALLAAVENTIDGEADETGTG